MGQVNESARATLGPAYNADGTRKTDLTLTDCRLWITNEANALVYDKAAGDELPATNTLAVAPTLTHIQDGIYALEITPNSPTTGEGDWTWELSYPTAGVLAYEQLHISDEGGQGGPGGYATPAEVASYLCVDLSTLPGDIRRMIRDASDVVDHASMERVRTNIDPRLTKLYADAARDATCAQVAHWLNVGEDTDYGRQLEQYSLGRTSLKYARAPLAGAAAGDDQLCRRAYRILFRAGLTYRGARMSGRWATGFWPFGDPPEMLE